MNRKVKILLAVFLISIISVISVGYSEKYFEISKNLDVFVTLYKELNNYYVDDVNPGKTIKKAIDSMLKSLDPYTTYIPESKIEDFRFMTTGQYGGIGAIITKINEYVYINEPYEDFPAQKAGLMAGDKILEINGVSAKNKTTEDVSKILKGQPNTMVKILIERGVSKPNGMIEQSQLDVSFNREEIKVKSIPYYGFIKKGIAYIKLRSFTKECSKELKRALNDLKNKEQLKGMILDLRGNPGGLLNESVKIANLFLPKGQEVVRTKGKIKSWEKIYKANQQPLDLVTPLVILINKSSASASEIVAGSIQDLDRGVIIGERSFGKGLVQQTRELSYNSKLKLTVAKYYIPSGRCIQAVDFSNRNNDGSVGKIPDSLITEFKTKNGRLVYDGGGINPDVLIYQQKNNEFLAQIYKNRHFFNFATDYRIRHKSLDTNYVLTEEEYLEFINYLSEKGNEYKTSTEKALEDLKEKIKEDEYFSENDYNIFEKQYDLIIEQAKNQKLKNPSKHKEEIKEILTGEITSRYYYQKGRIQSTLLFDEAIKKSLGVLQNAEEYESILSGIQ